MTDNQRTYTERELGKNVFWTFVLTALIVGTLVYTATKAPDSRPYYNDTVTEEYIMSCDIYEVCQWHPIMTCLSIDPNKCGKVYQCQKTFKNCEDKSREEGESEVR